MQPEVTPQSNKNPISIPLAILGAGAMIAAAVFFGGTRVEVGSTVENLATPLDVMPLSDKDHILGSKNAKIVIVEYSDLECPFCKLFHNTMHRVVSSYNGQVAWIYRHFPIVDLHSRAIKEAEASECATEQGGNSVFWSYIDKIFERTNSGDTLDPRELSNIASELNLDVQRFNNCLSSGTFSKAIDDDIKEAIRAGARGTPYSVIFKDGKLVEGSNGIIGGHRTFDQIKPLIDALLN